MPWKFLLGVVIPVLVGASSAVIIFQVADRLVAIRAKARLAQRSSSNLASKHFGVDLLEALADSDENVRKSAVAAVLRIGGPVAITGLRQALRDQSEQVVLQAVNGLRDIRDREVVELLVHVLTRRERSLQLAATDALVRIGGDVVGPLLEAFKDQALRRRIGNQISKILVDMGTQSIDPLLQVLSDENQYVRITAISVLGRIGDRRVAAALVHLFLDDLRMQEAVVTTLARLEERQILEPVGIAVDREIALPREVIDGFLARPREDVTRLLTEALENPSPKVRRFALKAMSALYGDTALDNLVTALSDDDIDVKQLAIKLMSKIRNKRVIEPLVQLILHDGERIEEAAWNALKVLTDLREYEELRARVAKERASARPSRNVPGRGT